MRSWSEENVKGVLTNCMSSKSLDLQTVSLWDKTDLQMYFVLSLNVNIFRQLCGLHRSHYLPLSHNWSTSVFKKYLLATEDM